MVRGTDVSDPAHVGRQGFASPSFAPENKSHLRGQFRSSQKELFDSLFPVGQAVSDKCQIARQSWIRWYGVVPLRIERVVNGIAVACTEACVVVHHRR